jgi:hypothetical protein
MSSMRPTVKRFFAPSGAHQRAGRPRSQEALRAITPKTLRAFLLTTVYWLLHCWLLIRHHRNLVLIRELDHLVAVKH